MLHLIFFIVIVLIIVVTAVGPAGLPNVVGGGEDYSSFNRQVFGKYPLKPGKSLKDVKMTKEGRYSSSTQHDIIKTLEQCRKFADLPDEIIVTDATANVGGSTLAFASQVKHVNAVEISKETFDILKHNVSLFDFDNITLINDNYLNIFATLTQDLIFVDPPWGGPDYKDKDKVSLYLGDINLSNLFVDLAPHAKVICAKVPFNFDKKEFEAIANANHLTYEYHDILNIKGKVKWINVICAEEPAHLSEYRMT